jgi:hypothetical protein
MQSSNLPNVWKNRGGSSLTPGLDRLRRREHSFEQAMFLRRFQELLEKKRLYSSTLKTSDWRRRLIDKALYSTYCDCLDLDVRDEVRDILQRGQTVVKGKSVATA